MIYPLLSSNTQTTIMSGYHEIRRFWVERKYKTKKVLDYDLIRPKLVESSTKYRIISGYLGLIINSDISPVARDRALSLQKTIKVTNDLQKWQVSRR